MMSSATQRSMNTLGLRHVWWSKEEHLPEAASSLAPSQNLLSHFSPGLHTSQRSQITRQKTKSLKMSAFVGQD